MLHSKACPHDCKACVKVRRWFVGAWKLGGCVVCGCHRGKTSWACQNCWDGLTPQQQMDARLAMDKGL